MNFSNLVEKVLHETNVIGGSASVMGPNVTNTASAFSGDNWNMRDNRIAKSLYSGVLTRNGKISYKKIKRKKQKNK